jgi:hypothetical protein
MIWWARILAGSGARVVMSMTGLAIDQSKVIAVCGDLLGAFSGWVVRDNQDMGRFAGSWACLVKVVLTSFCWGGKVGVVLELGYSW